MKARTLSPKFVLDKSAADGFLSPVNLQALRSQMQDLYASYYLSSGNQCWQCVWNDSLKRKNEQIFLRLSANNEKRNLVQTVNQMELDSSILG